VSSFPQPPSSRGDDDRSGDPTSTPAPGGARTAPDGPGGAAGPDGVAAAPALERAPGERPEIDVVALPGRVPYREGLELQRRLARARIEGGSQRDLLLLLEHDPVLTLGRGTEDGHLTAEKGELEARGVDVVEIERGGDVTYHGPGQLVGYPILDLGGYRRDLHWYLRAVEEALILALGRLGLPAFRVPDHTGVWVGRREALEGGDGAPAGEPGAGGASGPAAARGTEPDAGRAIVTGRVRKVASIGIHVSRWVTWHGFALNVTDEALERFDLIVPCGIRGVRMTSLASEGVAAGERRIREAVAAGFASAFGARMVDREEVPEP
jgi:lipoyl(octanoyl) transferase